MAGRVFSLGDRVWYEGGWDGFILSVHYPPRPSGEVTMNDPEAEVMIYWTFNPANVRDDYRYTSMRRSNMRWVEENRRWELTRAPAPSAA